MFCHACMVWTVCFIVWWNILVAVRIFSLAKYSCSIGVHFVLSGMHNVHSLFILWCKILALVNDNFELVPLDCALSILSGMQNILFHSMWIIYFCFNWIAVCLLNTYGLFCLIFSRKILLEAVAILSFLKYSWPIGLQIVLVGMHGMHLCSYYWESDSKLFCQA